MAIASVLLESRKMLVYGTSLGLMAAIALVSIPIYIANAGAQGWASIALGQAFGVAASVAIAYGWGVQGSARYSRLSSSERWVEVRDSLILRAFLAIPVVLLSGVLVYNTADDFRLAFAGLISIAVVGFRLNWVFIAEDLPTLALLLETGPRFLLQALGLLMVLAGSLTVEFALYAQALGQIAASLCGAIWVRLTYRQFQKGYVGVRCRLISHYPGTAAATLSAMASVIPTVVVQGIAPAALPAYAILNRIQMQVGTALSPVVDYLQGWVYRKGSGSIPERSSRAVAIGLGVGGVVTVSAIVTFPTLFRVLSSGELKVDFIACAIVSVVVGSTFCAQVVGRAGLIANGLVLPVSRALVLGLVVSVGLAPVLTHFWGLRGVLVAVSLGWTVNLAFTAWIFYRVGSRSEASAVPSVGDQASA